jgi:hypothetical protein
MNQKIRYAEIIDMNNLFIFMIIYNRE